MATRALLAELAAGYTRQTGVEVAIEAVGGVDAARRVAAGEAFDLVILAAEAIERLLAGGHLAVGSRVDLVCSPVAVAVPAGAARPDIGSEAALREAVLAAPSLALSTGPSGDFLARLFERWGIAGQIGPRLVHVPPGVPVGSLVAGGQAALGFQQLSELLPLPGVDVLGTLPPEVACITTFAAALPARPAVPPHQAQAVRALLAFMNSAAAVEVKRRHGMTPA